MRHSASDSTGSDGSDVSDDSATHPLARGFRLNGFTVLPEQRLVVSPTGAEVKLENRVMNVLLELACHPGQTLSEDHFMEGTETLLLREDGTFRHTFRSTDYSYESPKQQWEFISADDEPDGPKLRMEGMKYFAEGITQANSRSRI